MSDMACMSPFHFSRVFRSVTGLPPGSFQGALRLVRAKELLLTTRLSVTDIYFEIGYLGLGTFSSLFQHRVGLGPERFRRLVDEEEPPDWQFVHSAITRTSLARQVFEPTVEGTLTAPQGYAGVAFLGLFPRYLPEGEPVAWTVTLVPGYYQIGPIPYGHYHVMAAATSKLATWQELLLSQASLVATESALDIVGPGRVTVDLALRQRRVEDPPILTALALGLVTAGKRARSKKR